MQLQVLNCCWYTAGTQSRHFLTPNTTANLTSLSALSDIIINSLHGRNSLATPLSLGLGTMTGTTGEGIDSFEVTGVVKGAWSVGCRRTCCWTDSCRHDQQPQASGHRSCPLLDPPMTAPQSRAPAAPQSRAHRPSTVS